MLVLERAEFLLGNLARNRERDTPVQRAILFFELNNALHNARIHDLRREHRNQTDDTLGHVRGQLDLHSGFRVIPPAARSRRKHVRLVHSLLDVGKILLHVRACYH